MIWRRVEYGKPSEIFEISEGCFQPNPTVVPGKIASQFALIVVFTDLSPARVLKIFSMA